MRDTLFALLAATTLAAGSGCCCVDHFCGHHFGCGNECDGCAEPACSYCGPHCGACGCGKNCACPPGGCADGNCGPGGCADTGGPAHGGDGYAKRHGKHGAYAKQLPAPQGYGPGDCGPGGCGPEGCGPGGCGPVPYGRACNCCPVPDCYTNHQAVASQLGGPAGPPCGQVTYPYYTTRGPRDYFVNNPPTIGP